MENNIKLEQEDKLAANTSFSNKNIIITILVGLLVLSFLGINLLSVGGELFQVIANIFGPLVTQILSIFGYTAGTLITTSADVTGDAAKTGIDIAEGTIHSVGGLLKNMSRPHVDDKARNQLDNGLNIDLRTMPVPVQAPAPVNAPNREAEPDKSSNPIQKPITSGKTQWCLVGEYEGKRGCIEISNRDKCLSGQVFPEQKLCLNPTFTQNRHPLKSVPE